MKEVTPEELSKRVEVERIKDASNYLRGTLVESLHNPLTGALAEPDTQLCKFHGIYQQDDRDIRDERRKQKLEPHYQFMVRVRVPGGVCTPQQWLQVDRIANTWCNRTIRLTTRQAYQFHGIIKRDLKTTMAEINAALLDTIAACGDVNRNVMCNVNPEQSRLHEEVHEYTRRISEHLTPRTTAYHEIWLDKELVATSRKDEEPIYGKHYLPRKFKTAVAIPPSNDVDIFANDLGFIAIAEHDRLAGFNVTVGGGMGMTHGEPETYPRLADVLGFCPKEKTLQVAEEIVKIQRDFGDRTNRKHARFKYTIDDRGIDWLRFELNQRLGWNLEPPRPYIFEDSGDRYGWVEGQGGLWFHTLFIQNGRILDTDDYPMMTGLREIAKVHDGDFRLTGNQNLVIGRVSAKKKPAIDKLLKKYKLADTHHQTGLRLNSMACVAFPTCALAMAESERYLPTLLDKLDAVMKDAGLEHDPIVIRMTGCPNGCARPFLGEIGFVGKAPGKYNLYLGAGFFGQRLNKMYRENIGEEQILAELTPMIHRYAAEREPGEKFGDFVIRAGYVKPVLQGREFHA
ncbi:MAG TPA: assimilatory sulfite reductase (NADPH) hemoprotein subunit [Kiritimatiellia bacterium]|nr:assimilatory sulfite reductase (NADPH) hemoprotein subunit [Kiritimatiellia bacterium]HMO97843.1 assimilatory sulfite reductase (NADPH) hemoprotein subunit [Kiritimatiellia bacterium]HMP97599.1 assimilatory sulfite reductase (NADPH) hemoprotein subunit [Kiritimatiellia bacterium]